MAIKGSVLKSLALLASSTSSAVALAGDPVGVDVGSVVGEAMSVAMVVAVGADLPIGLGGVAAITALSLIIGVQLIRRKKP